MLWKVRIPLRTKLALIGIFSLTVITMIFSIVREIVVPVDGKINADITWLSLWSNIEMGIGS